MCTPADAVRMKNMINYFSYNYPQPEKDKTIFHYNGICLIALECKKKTSTNWNKRKEVALEEAPDNNLVFL